MPTGEIVDGATRWSVHTREQLDAERNCPATRYSSTSDSMQPTTGRRTASSNRPPRLAIPRSAASRDVGIVASTSRDEALGILAADERLERATEVGSRGCERSRRRSRRSRRRTMTDSWSDVDADYSTSVSRACCPLSCPVHRDCAELSGDDRPDAYSAWLPTLRDAGGGGRTHTSRRTRDFESRASASSATPARSDRSPAARCALSSLSLPCASLCSPVVETSRA